MSNATPTPAELREERIATARNTMKRLMLITCVVALVVLVAALSWLYLTGTPMTFHFIVAVTVTVIGCLALAAGLMGLLFFSNSSGADEDQV